MEVLYRHLDQMARDSSIQVGTCLKNLGPRLLIARSTHPSNTPPLAIMFCLKNFLPKPEVDRDQGRKCR